VFGQCTRVFVDCAGHVSHVNNMSMHVPWIRYSSTRAKSITSWCCPYVNTTQSTALYSISFLSKVSCEPVDAILQHRSQLSVTENKRLNSSG